MSSSTSLRSPFWLTDRLGRTSHPTNKVGLGEIETVKHPSPSTNPEMYDGRSTRPCREPACCSGHRFATLQPYGWGCDSDAEPRPFGLSRYGAIPAHAGRGLPTALPAVYRLVPYRGSRCALRRYERV